MNFNFLFPKQPHFFEYFEENADCLREIAGVFYALTKDYRDFERYAKAAKEIEKKGDQITRKIIDTLNRTVITPLDREDIHLIARKTDRAVDQIEGAIRKINFYQVEQKVAALDDFGELIHKACNQTTQITKYLKKPCYSRELRKLVLSVHKLEDEGDAVFKKAIVELFQKEKDPIVVIKWKDILEDLENSLDLCKKLSNLTEGVIIKSC